MTIGDISRAKLQSDHHHQQTNTQFHLQSGCPSCRPTNSVDALNVDSQKSTEQKLPWVVEAVFRIPGQCLHVTEATASEDGSVNKEVAINQSQLSLGSK